MSTTPDIISASTRCPACESALELVNGSSHETWKTLKSLLRGNAHPSTSPTSHIVQLLGQAETDIERCDVELGRLQQLIDQLEFKKVALKSHVEGYKSLLTPIRKLPSELLREVFLFVCCNNTIKSKDEECIVDVPGIAISQTCAHWRALALSCPAV